MRHKITVIGSANIDYVMQMTRLPSKGETVTANHFAQTFGGKGANQAVAAARAGADVTFIACLGDDVLADSYQHSLKADAIDCSHIQTAQNTETGSAMIMLDASGDNYLSITEGANAQCTSKQIHNAQACIAASEWIILQQEIPCATNLAALAIAADNNIPVLLNYAPATDMGLRLDGTVHGLVVNETEAAQLLQQPFSVGDLDECAQAATTLKTRGDHQFVALTLGSHGVTVATAEGTQHYPALKVTAVDTTAAGDTFCGTLAVALAEGKALTEAVNFASTAAALAVTKLGAQPSIPSRSSIDQQLAHKN